MTPVEQDGLPPLRPPGATPPASAAPPANGWRLWLVLALLLLGVGVVLVLPGWLDGDQAAAVNPPSALPAPEVAPARQQAEQQLQKFLRLQAELGLLRAPEWASAEWATAAQQAGQGDRRFGERRFDDAAQAYAEGVALLETLKTTRPERLADSLVAGRQALERDAAVAAQADFEQALAIDRDNTEAQTGLARARVRAQVVELVAEATRAETAQQEQAAAAAYRQALALDAAYSPAQEGLARVTAALDARAFDNAIGEALAALSIQDFDAADAALERAAGIDPGAVALVDTRERLRRARRQATLDTLRAAATTRVRAEDWQGAAERYRKALRIDSAAGFARAGLAGAEQRATLHRQFDHYLDDPARLYSAEPLANAEQLLRVTGSAPAAEPKLADKIARLQQLVQQARQPLPVALRSDGETDVVIYHVGRLGRFVDHQLSLPPGTYTAVGSRSGYRDVRRVFEVHPGRPSPTVEIRCEEPV